MTDNQKIQIEQMRTGDYSYAMIAEALGLSRESVKKYCQRHPISETETSTETDSTPHLCCKYCGNSIPIVHGRRQPRFCSTSCRRAWWKEHPESGTRKAFYTIICAGCGQSFQSYGNAGRKYCSHDCYIRSRFKGGDSNG